MLPSTSRHVPLDFSFSHPLPPTHSFSLPSANDWNIEYSSFVTIIMCLHPHSIITLHCTCCCDEIKGYQISKIGSHADSPILSRPLSPPSPRCLILIGFGVLRPTSGTLELEAQPASTTCRSVLSARLCMERRRN